MPKIHVEKSVRINAPAEKVFSAITDFHHWPSWSPWLIAEPEAKVDIAADGKYYSWDGKRVGAGEMTILRESAGERVDYDLTFLKPWKSTAKVGFHCQADGDGTRVSWSMDSSLPFFMFWMKKSMVAFIGSDYERGLAMLKEYVESGEVKSKLEFKGVEQYPGHQYVGIQRATSQTKMGDDMKADFEQLGAYLAEHPDLAIDRMFSIYHKWDMVKQQVAYTAGFPVKEIPSDLPAGFTTGSIPATSVYTLRHAGAYEHLGNAWSTLYMMQRNKEFKSVKGIHPFETYLNSPQEVKDTSELLTEIHFAVQA